MKSIPTRFISDWREKLAFFLTTSAIEMLTLNARKMSCGVNKMTMKVVLETLGSGWIILYNLYQS